MTRTIRSETNDKHYFLTIDEAGHATGCSCPDRYYRKHTCKHMAHFDEQMRKIAAFAFLFRRFDCRANGDEDSRRCYYELALAS